MYPLLLHADPARPGNQEFIEIHRPHMESELLKQIRLEHNKKPIQLFFSYFYNSCISPSIIEEIKRLGIMTVNFYCNNVHQFHLVSEIASTYDYCMVPEKVAMKKYIAIGANPIHIQMAANPNVYRPYLLTNEFDVTFAGQRYANRPQIIDYLLRKGIKIHVWGPGWLPSTSVEKTYRNDNKRAILYSKIRKSGLHLPVKVVRWLYQQPMEKRLHEIAGPSLTDEALIKLYSRSKISLGFSVVNNAVPKGEPDSHLRLRDFEAPMSGAFYATGYSEELEEYYEIDKEIICYKSKEELADKIQYYLGHLTELEKIRKAGYQRAQRDHTWIHRFIQLFDIVGLKNIIYF